jgi:hypothetical protein
VIIDLSTKLARRKPTTTYDYDYDEERLRGRRAVLGS